MDQIMTVFLPGTPLMLLLWQLFYIMSLLIRIHGLAYSGYLFATTTGVFRVLNNKHWVGDVLVGAGIGILVTDLVYRFEPLKNWNPFKNKKTKVIMSPTYTDNKFGLYANLQF